MQLSWFVWATVLASLMIAPEIHAAEPTQAELAQRREEAAKRYDLGVHAYQEARYKDAIDLFLEADKLAPSSALSFNIARAYEKIKDSSNALSWYRDYLRREPNAEDKDAVNALIQQYEAALQEKGVQQVTVRSEPETATVRVDGRPVGVTPWTGDLPPGKHSVALTLRGYADSERDIELAADEAKDVSIRLVPATEPAPVPAAPLAGPKGTKTTGRATAPGDTGAPKEPEGVGVLTYVVLGAGVATLGTAGGFELLRRSSEKDAENATTQIEYSDALDQMEQRQTIARVALGVGGALTLAGGVLLVLDLTDGSSASPEQAILSRPLAASAGCGPGRCFVSMRGSF